MADFEKRLAEHWDHEPLVAFVERSETYRMPRGQMGYEYILDTMRVQDAAHLTSGSRLLSDGEAQVPQSIQLVVSYVGDVGGTPPPDLSRLTEGSWHRVTVDKSGTYPVKVFEDLDGASTAARMLTVLPTDSLKKLKELVSPISLSELPDVDSGSILKTLASTGVRASRVAVYDVGQGNANAPCDLSGMPLVYYDLGGGCLQNASTYSVHRKWCFTRAQSIVLSHWDYDHWFSATHTKSALRSKWIAPRQPIGPRTMAFAKSILTNNGSIQIWRRGSGSIIAAPFGNLIQCTGSSKNDSGIALWVTTNNGEEVLCPADSEFRFIPGLAASTSLDGLVAAHHGSAHVGKFVPKAKTGGDLALSYGLRNVYGHPAITALSAYARAGWNVAMHTHQGAISLAGAASSVPCQGQQCDLITVQ